MDGPFIFIATHTIRDGKLEEFKADCMNMGTAIEENEPQRGSFNCFLQEDQSEVTVVQVHPDAESMLTHMHVANAYIRHSTDDQLVTKEIHIFGTANDAVVGMIQ